MGEDTFHRFDGVVNHLSAASAKIVEFPGFGGHPVAAVSEPPRTARGSGRPDDYAGGRSPRGRRTRLLCAVHGACGERDAGTLSATRRATHGTL